MNNINILKNLVVDREKVNEMVGQLTVEELSELLKVQKSQAYYVRNGQRMPTVHGLVRLMMYYNLQPSDLVALENNSTQSAQMT
jgi:plasmid maintenance system antidote protein VapI